MSNTMMDLIPAIAAIMALAFYTKRTRWYCVALALLAIGDELVPYVDSTIALTICVACLLGIVANEVFRRIPAMQHYYKES